MSQPCNSPTWDFVEEQVTKSLLAKRQQCTNSPSTSPPVTCDTWVLNDRKYFRMIVRLWEWQFKVEKLSRVHLASFNRRRQRAERRLLRCEKDFWTMADPEIDAWMLVTGRTRDVFDLEAFAKTYGCETAFADQKNR